MKYQLTCPKCHHEFAYDNGYIDKNITQLGHEIEDIKAQLAKYKLLPYSEQLKRKEWRLRAMEAMSIKMRDIKDLKAIRKACDQQVNAYMYQVFKDLVKERFGETVYKELLEAAKKECEAYTASGLMRHEYSRRDGGSITSINKL